MEKPKPENAQDIDQRWTPAEVNLLHDMVRDYDRAKWLRGQLRWWALWLLGLPTFVLTVWEPIVRLWKLLRGAA